jgi:DNA-binding NarL/FixJ family response regulator
MKDHKIKVAILEDFPMIVDGYIFRLNQQEDIEVVASANYGIGLYPMLDKNEIDVLILDVEVPMRENSTTFLNTLNLVPQIFDDHPNLQVLVISMHDSQTLIKQLLEKGVSGYLLKDDYKKIGALDEAIRQIYAGDMVISEAIYQKLHKAPSKSISLTKRERDILSFFIKDPGVTTPEIAKDLGIAVSTVRNTLSKLYQKLDVQSKNAAIQKTRELGLLPDDFPAGNAK